MLLYYLLGIILIPGIIFAVVAQTKVTNAYDRYKKIACAKQLTASQVARQMLDGSGLKHIQIKQIQGHLTDNYNPKTGVISLSQSVYNDTSVAAIGIAAHEVGHAIQFRDKYKPLIMRNIIIPIVNISSRMLWPLIVIGILFNFLIIPGSVFGEIMLWVGIVFFGLSMILSVITLPVEYDASKRAYKMLTATDTLTNEEAFGAKNVLDAAALTYVAALVVSILSFLRFLLFILSVRRN
ncbi:MAG: zinc metallopeptidase [Clostridia bacterium]|nr:zinc metallopeptidase [Clostridia bacterium]